jgi:hypothetical protein
MVVGLPCFLWQAIANIINTRQAIQVFIKKGCKPAHGLHPYNVVFSKILFGNFYLNFLVFYPFVFN